MQPQQAPTTPALSVIFIILAAYAIAGSDKNHVGPLFRKEPGVVQKLASLPADTQLRVCTITLGEIHAGHRIAQTTNQRQRDDYVAFVNATLLTNALPISHSTGLYYAQILERIWQQNPPASSRKRTERHLLDLGVDINDVWVVAAAWEHGLILVTNDKMECIRKAVPEVQMENWL